MTRALLLLGVLALVACSDADAPPAVDETDVSYTVRGLYLGPLYDGEAASITHEAIPDVMEAMTMPFRLDDPALIEGLEPDTPIRFTFEDRGAGYRVTAVEPLPADTPLDLAP